MTRATLIEQITRNLAGGQPNDDFPLTPNLINLYISQGIALAAKQNYKENDAMEGIAYVNNSFYTTFRAIAPTYYEKYTWRIALPEIPVGIGSNMGISTIELKDSQGNLTYPLIPLTENQRSYFATMAPIPNKTLYYYEGAYAYIKSTLILNQYTASVTMISGGDSTDLTSQLNVPGDYIPLIIEYCMNKLIPELNVKTDAANDGVFVK